MRTPAGEGGRSLGSSDASGNLRFGATGAWRLQFPRLTPSRHRVLAALARGGDTLTIDHAGTIRLRSSGAVVPHWVAVALIANRWVTEPLPALPLFGEPAVDGHITGCGVAALNRGNSNGG